MRKLITIVFIGFLSLSPYQTKAQWELVFKDTTDWGFKDIHFFDADTGYVIGSAASLNGSVLLKTVDGGQIWDTILFLGSHYFKAIDFPCRDTGYIAFSNPFNVNVLRTIDGGLTWQQTTNNLLVGNTTMAIDFYDSKTGVLSLSTYSWKTTDAGITWDLITTNPSGALHASISDSIYAGIGGTFVAYTFDTCSTFMTTYTNSGGSGTDVFLKGAEAYISGIGQNGGTYGYGHHNFGVIAIGDLTIPNFRSYHFPYPEIYQMRGIWRTDNFIYAVSYPFNYSASSGQFLKSIDDGQTWYTQSFADTADMFFVIEQIFCVNDNVCYARGGGRIYKTTNGGGPLIQQMGFEYNVGVDENNLSEEINIFPNPSSGEFSIKSEKLIEEIYVYDITGKLILQQIPNTNQSVVHLSAVSGMYFVKIKTDTGIISKRIIRY